jgi:TPR repeat protein
MQSNRCETLHRGTPSAPPRGVVKKVFSFLAVAALLAAADFQAGLDAYNRGDYAAAMQEWQPLAEQGEAHAQYNLGLLYARGQGVPRDYAKAAEWYRKAAEQGVPAAEYNLGVMYANGQGVKADSREASKWFLKAAQHHIAGAELGLGQAYYEGEGAFHNYTEAEQWYRKAADQGIASAAFDLAVMYDLGQGVTQNYEEALKWYHNAADHGYAPACSNIGILYYNGQGVKRDLVQAYNWFARAQNLGDPRAGSLIEAAANKMRPKDIKKAQQLAKTWTPPEKGQATQTAAADLFKPRPTPVEAAANGAATAGEASRTVPGGVTPAASPGMAAANRPVTMPNTEVAATAGTAAATPGAAAATPGTAAATAPGTAAATPGAAAATAPGTAAATPGAAAANRPVTMPNTEAATAPGAAASAVPQPPTPNPQPLNFSPPPPKPAPLAPEGAAAGTIPAPGTPLHTQDIWTGVRRVVAVGDVHGDYEQFVAVLRSAGLIDAHGNWSGGKAHLVQTGDIVDRGPDSRAVMDLLMKLEKQAAAAGGGVHCLIGNHEAMDVYGDLRYVSPAEFAAFHSGGAAIRRAAYPDGLKDITAPATPRTPGNGLGREDLPGFAEHRQAFGPDGKYGRWIRSHNTAIKIDRTLYVHAGISAKYADWSLDQINDAVREELNDFTRLHGGLVTDVDGPLWYRGLAEGDEAKVQPEIDRLLKHFDVDRIVIGHVYDGGAVMPRFGGRVLLIDVGLSRVYDNVGKVGCLEIDDGHAYALHRGEGIELPRDENGPDMLRYLEQAAALDPKPSPLLGRINALMKK